MRTLYLHTQAPNSWSVPSTNYATDTAPPLFCTARRAGGSRVHGLCALMRVAVHHDVLQAPQCAAACVGWLWRLHCALKHRAHTSHATCQHTCQRVLCAAPADSPCRHRAQMIHDCASFQAAVPSPGLAAHAALHVASCSHGACVNWHTTRLGRGCMCRSNACIDLRQPHASARQ